MVREHGPEDVDEPGTRDEGGARRPDSVGRGRPVEREPTGPICELCGSTMLDRHCKVVCLNCGYQRDCSDP